jgi:hypothetical protein
MRGLSDSINNEFNEYGAMAEPPLCKHFDGSEITAITLILKTACFPYRTIYAVY